MQKKKIRHRLRLFTVKGMKCYLDFLRNLMPQILLVSAVFLELMRVELNPRSLSWGNILGILAFMVLLAGTILAIWSNVAILYYRSFSSLDRHLRDSWRSFSDKGVNRIRIPGAIIYSIWRDHLLLEYAELFFMVFLLPIVLSVVAGMALHQAAAIWFQGQPGKVG